MPNGKPRGLWYCFGTEWLEYCLSNFEGWFGDHLRGYELILDDSKILHVEGSMKGISNLYEVYGDFRYDSLPIIKWDEVGKDYAGVEFFPYNKLDIFNMKDLGYTLEASLLFAFISSLDVASGCIWNDSAILEIKEPIEVEL